MIKLEMDKIYHHSPLISYLRSKQKLFRTYSYYNNKFEQFPRNSPRKIKIKQNIAGVKSYNTCIIIIIIIIPNLTTKEALKLGRKLVVVDWVEDFLDQLILLRTLIIFQCPPRPSQLHQHRVLTSSLLLLQESTSNLNSNILHCMHEVIVGDQVLELIQE